jgi:hypothetical protein
MRRPTKKVDEKSAIVTYQDSSVINTWLSRKLDAVDDHQTASLKYSNVKKGDIS